MFYKKSDAEIYCETLLALVEKQAKFIEEYGVEIKSPYADAIHALIGKVECHLDLPSKHAANNAQAPLENTKAEKKSAAPKEKSKQPARRYFHSTKSPLQVIHGHSDDAAPVDTIKPTITENPSRPEVASSPPANNDSSGTIVKATPGQSTSPIEKIEEVKTEWRAEAGYIDENGSHAYPKKEVVVTDTQVTPENIDQLAEKVVENFDNQPDPTILPSK